jgi:hypothetical protein
LPIMDHAITPPDATIDVPGTRSPGEAVLTPAQALAKLVLGNADWGANADNDTVVELLKRRRAIQSLVNPSGR